MHDDLAGAGIDVHILGVNQVGHESGNPNVCAGRDIPWLQETVEQEVWMTWGITYRDVIILDGDNRVFAIYNLTEHNLATPENYAELRALFEAAANNL